MANDKLPLFVQDGIYPARLDRTLTGGLLNPSGEGMFPLAGVRPQGVDAYGETSFRVSVSGGVVRIEPGSAFVGDVKAQGLGGIYFIFNEGPHTESLIPIIPGVGQEALVGISVNDPGLGGSAMGQGSWKPFVLERSLVPKENVLILASIGVPGVEGGPTPVTDLRTYTSALGGVVVTRDNLTTIIAKYGAMPYGTQIYSAADGITYTRGTNGWAQNPAIAKVVTGSVVGPGRVGELAWETSKDTLYVYEVNNGVPAWIPIARASASVRTAYYDPASPWAVGPNSANISEHSFNITIKADANDWYSIGNENVELIDPAPGENKPDEKQLILHVRSTADKAYFAVELIAAVHVKKVKPPEPPPETEADAPRALDLVTDDDNSLSIGVEILKVNNAALENGQPPAKNDDTKGFYVMKVIDGLENGMTWTGNGGQRAHTMTFGDLEAGVYQIRPVFKKQAYGYFEISKLFMKVTTK